MVNIPNWSDTPLTRSLELRPGELRRTVGEALLEHFVALAKEFMNHERQGS